MDPVLLPNYATSPKACFLIKAFCFNELSSPNDWRTEQIVTTTAILMVVIIFFVVTTSHSVCNNTSSKVNYSSFIWKVKPKINLSVVYLWSTHVFVNVRGIYVKSCTWRREWWYNLHLDTVWSDWTILSNFCKVGTYLSNIFKTFTLNSMKYFIVREVHLKEDWNNASTTIKVSRRTIKRLRFKSMTSCWKKSD